MRANTAFWLHVVLVVLAVAVYGLAELLGAKLPQDFITWIGAALVATIGGHSWMTRHQIQSDTATKQQTDALDALERLIQTLVPLVNGLQNQQANPAESTSTTPTEAGQTPTGGSAS